MFNLTDSALIILDLECVLFMCVLYCRLQNQHKITKIVCGEVHKIRFKSEYPAEAMLGRGIMRRRGGIMLQTAVKDKRRVMRVEVLLRRTFTISLRMV